MIPYCLGRASTAPAIPIDSASDALALVLYAAATPPRSEIVVILLDQRRCLVTMLTVTSPPDADGIFAVLDAVLGAPTHEREFHEVILASCRPGGGVGFDDADRWMEASDLCAWHGIRLVEWFVLGAAVECPRDLLGEPPRWTMR